MAILAIIIGALLLLGAVGGNYFFLMKILQWHQESQEKRDRESHEWLKTTNQLVAQTVRDTVSAVTSQLYGPSDVPQSAIDPEQATMASQEWFQQPNDDDFDPATWNEPDPVQLREPATTIRPGDMPVPDTSAENLK